MDFSACHHSRLLVEVNRSIGHPQLFSEYSDILESDQKTEVIEKYYQPYREEVEKKIRKQIASQPVVHLSIHTFTPVRNGQERFVEIGLLFDEQRRGESWFCAEWMKELNLLAPQLAVVFNEPYKGADDGFTTYLRTQFSDREYLGIELEVNQKFVNSPLDELAALLTRSLRDILITYAYSGE